MQNTEPSSATSIQTEEPSLRYNSKKQVFKSALLGVCIGLAVIVPGVSGAVMAIIFHLYEKLLYAMGNLFRRFKKCIVFLLPILIGGIVGFAGGFFGVQQLIDLLPFAIVALFTGLMTGSYPAITDQLKGEKRTVLRVVLFWFGLLIPVAISLLSVFRNNADRSLENLLWYDYLFFLILGYVIAVTQVVPGLSATALLMMIGYFSPIVGSVGMSLFSDAKLLFAFVCLGIGFLIGLFTFSKILSRILEKYRAGSFSLIAGLSLGAIVTMFFNPEIYAVYTAWASSGVVWWELILGIVLFALGAMLSYRLIVYERKHTPSQGER